MGARIIIESAIVGLAAQAVVGWVTPLALVFTGFIAGAVAHNRHNGTIAGLIVGATTGFGFIVRWHFNFEITYLYPAMRLVGMLGPYGVYIIALVMLVLGVVGGAVGGSVVQRYAEESYVHGELVGENKRVQRAPAGSKNKGPSGI